MSFTFQEVPSGEKLYTVAQDLSNAACGDYGYNKHRFGLNPTVDLAGERGRPTDILKLLQGTGSNYELSLLFYRKMAIGFVACTANQTVISDGSVEPVFHGTLIEAFGVAPHSEIRRGDVYKLLFYKGVDLADNPPEETAVLERTASPKLLGVRSNNGSLAEAAIREGLSGFEPFSERGNMKRDGYKNRSQYAILYTPIKS